LWGHLQQPQQESVAALVIVASLIAHTGRNSMANKKLKPGSATPNRRSFISHIPDPHYWLALGEFVERFALAEIALFAYLARCADIPRATANAVLSGNHADQMIKLVRRLWQVKPPDNDLRDKVEDALTQFNIINEVRANVVHYGSFFTDDKGRVSSNVSRALTLEERHFREIRVSPYVLKDMSIDLEKIGHHFVYANLAILDPRVSREELAGGLPALADAWRYKRPEDQNPSMPPRKQRRRQQQPTPANQR
jgi:hypothetical protein